MGEEPPAKRVNPSVFPLELHRRQRKCTYNHATRIRVKHARSSTIQFYSSTRSRQTTSVLLKKGRTKSRHHGLRRVQQRGGEQQPARHAVGAPRNSTGRTGILSPRRLLGLARRACSASPSGMRIQPALTDCHGAAWQGAESHHRGRASLREGDTGTFTCHDTSGARLTLTSAVGSDWPEILCVMRAVRAHRQEVWALPHFHRRPAPRRGEAGQRGRAHRQEIHGCRRPRPGRGA